MAKGSEFGSMMHLAARFFGALSPAGPAPDDEKWAAGMLLPGELELWRRMSGPDRRHAVGVARAALRLAAPHDAPLVPTGPAAPHDAPLVPTGPPAPHTAPSVPTGPPAPHDAAAASGPGREFVAAALLHDVGKVEAGIGTFPRVFVTLAAMAIGRRRLVDASRRRRPGTALARVGSYLSHDRTGGQLLRQAGSSAFTAEWAEQHHLPPERWSVDARLGWALKRADGD